MSEEKTEQAGLFALICSFFFPIVGVICYFVNKKEVKNASAYLWAALTGFVIGIILRFVGV